MKNKYIDEAIDAFRRQGVGYAKSERYYAGRHDLAFATEKFLSTFGTLFREFAMNLCPAICDAVRDKLKISGFSINAGTRTARPAVIAPDVGTRASLPASVARNAEGVPLEAGSLRSDIDRIWFRNRLQQRAGEIHKEALKNGDAYAIVWFDPAGEVTIYPQRAVNVAVTYGEDSPGQILWAAKYCRTSDKRTRLNIFYPDRIERYITKKECDAMLPEAKDLFPVSD